MSFDEAVTAIADRDRIVSIEAIRRLNEGNFPSCKKCIHWQSARLHEWELRGELIQTRRPAHCTALAALGVNPYVNPKRAAGCKLYREPEVTTF